MTIERLPTFLAPTIDAERAILALRSPNIRRVKSYALGPVGTNIEMAARKWAADLGLAHKHEVVICTTPELAVSSARACVEHGVLTVFWTCAVYVRENQIFFCNPDTLPLLFRVDMQLDCMQLATRTELQPQLSGGVVPGWWEIASHPSPAPLLAGLPNPIRPVNSNAVAAEQCRDHHVACCVTTESAARRCGLVTVHEFGSPHMVFFGGVTAFGAKLLSEA